MRAAAAVFLLALAGCASTSEPGTKIAGVPDALNFRNASFADLADWSTTDTRAAFGAFRKSCGRLAGKSTSEGFGGIAAYGTVGDWQPACLAAASASVSSAEAARGFFQTWFEPVQALNNAAEVGLFTGYYEPELRGSRTRGGRFQVPLLARPSDLVMVELGSFQPALKGERVAGRVSGGKLVPYATRAQIEGGALGSVASPIVFVDSATAAFFLHVQGSGRVRFEDGGYIRVAYDGQNGHPYTAVGRILVDRGEIAREKLSMQGIQAWLDANPAKAASLMNENASYVFFKELPIADPAMGADGAQGVPLTPEASLAVDMKFHALGAPVFIDANAPAPDASAPDVAFRRLVISQDTGGAIRGPVRGDVYWGAGVLAESVAGRMAHKGRMFVLLPKTAAQRLR